MENNKTTKLIILKLALWVIILGSGLSLLLHSKWLYNYNLDPVANRPLNTGGILPEYWLPTQIVSYVIFLLVGLLLQGVLQQYQKTNYFGQKQLRVFDYLIWATIALAILGALQLSLTNFAQMKDHFFGASIYINATIRFIFNLFVMDQPQTMYLLLAILLWVMKLFIQRALEIKAENEKYI